MQINNTWLAKEWTAISLFTFSLFLFFCLINSVHCGGLGEWCANTLTICWGDAKFFIPVCLAAFSISLFCNDSQCLFRGIWFVVFMACLDSFASVFWFGKFGCVGASISTELMSIGGGIGASLFLMALGILSMQHISPFSLKEMALKIKDSYFGSAEYVKPISVYSNQNRTWDVAMDRPWNIPRTLPVHSSVPMHEIETCLMHFGIAGVRVADQLKGPIVTRYFLSLPAGVRSSSIANLDRDIARSMSLASCRVVENIDGRPEIALELPNKNRETVTFNSIYTSKTFQESPFSLALIFGKDVGGEPVIGDLSKMPHLLVSGTTGSGKSMCLLSMLSGMILKHTPDVLRLILIDPKMVEFNCFDAIGHMMLPVITDMTVASNALAWSVNEMDRRYQLFMQNGTRDIDGFNKSQNEKLPRIVIAIDEFSDLFLADKKIETLIVSLAQKARTCGIHLILATQRPSADVITGLIKANIPARIALKTTSKIDSRIILDQGGAEQLLGDGDMLVEQGSEINRVHGAYLDHGELLEIISKTKNKYPAPKFIQLTSLTMQSENQIQDEMLEKAIDLIKEKGQASIRLFIRELKLGHTRASRLMQQLEEEEVVSGENEEGKREILI
ncbi:MAG: hypothetical protein A3E82_01960 [Gammaproteobacteria bacterium RIFCSPHIGHO2_12_FULL_38_11]|nr:MAG: hypothetical protein A3E82_01960 [Gammaproteobacteria bacterium RIFCSPHIGHO2_12_FULL_38_11]